MFLKRVQNFESISMNCLIEEEYIEKYINDNETYDIEIRCIRLDGNHNNEITWPDFCQISVNG